MNKVKLIEEEYLERSNLSRAKYEVRKGDIIKYFYEFNDRGLEFSIYDNKEFIGKPFFKEFYEPKKHFPDETDDNAAESENERIYQSVLKFLENIAID